MYGYVRPLRDELKLREYEQFRGVYCGLCHALKQRYGPLYRFAVSYDLTFLAMLLSGTEPVSVCPKRCPYRPLRKKAMCPEGSCSMDAAADMTVILAYHKMRDGVRDGGFFERIGCGLMSAAMKPAYRKASALLPAFSETAERELSRLSELEKEESPSLDAAADTFATMLSAAAEGDSARIMRELLYHLGRIVYILDAADDLKDDLKTGAYNPLLYRFRLREGKLTEEDEETLRLSLAHSHNALSSAYQLLPPGPYEGLLDNTIYYGLPAAVQAVFAGTWRARQRGRNRL